MDAGTFTQKKGSMMAEEEFDVNDMPVTDRYRIPYPGEDNLTRFAGQQFEAMATAVDKQLGEVDDRQTDAARSTIVRNTLAELQAVESKATGQFGYVTDDPDPDQIGIWCWNGDSWSKVSGATPMTVVKNTLAELQAVTGLSDGVMGLVTSDPIATNNGAYIRSNSVWSPITGTADGTLGADTLEQLEATTAPTGTLAYVSNDGKASNNGVYVRTAAGEWERVGAAGASFIQPVSKIPDENVKVVSRSGTSYNEKYTIGVAELPAIAVAGDAPAERTTYSDGTYTGLAAIRLSPGLWYIEDYSWPDITPVIITTATAKPAIRMRLTGKQDTDYHRIGNWVYVLTSTCMVFRSDEINDNSSRDVTIGDAGISDSNTSHDPGLPSAVFHEANLM